MDDKYRTIRQAPEFAKQIEWFELGYKRLDEIMDGVTWSIARNPGVFPLMAGTGLRLAKTDPFPNSAPLRIYFTWDEDDNCTLRWIEPMDDLPEEQDYSS